MNVSRALNIAFTVAVTGIALMFWHLFNEAAPVGTANRRVADQHVARNGSLAISNSAIFDKSCAAVIYRAIYDSEGTRVYTDTEFRPANSLFGQVTATRHIPIPEFTALGPAQYRVIVEWQCNFIQRLWPNVVELPVLNFEVTP